MATATETSQWSFLIIEYCSSHNHLEGRVVRLLKSDIEDGVTDLITPFRTIALLYYGNEMEQTRKNDYGMVQRMERVGEIFDVPRRLILRESGKAAF